MNQFMSQMPTKVLRSVSNSLPLLYSTIQKISQSSLHIFSQHSWIRYGLLSLGILVWLTTSNANIYQTGDTQGWILGSKWLKDCLLLVSSEACRRVSYWPIWNNTLALMFSWFTENQIKLWYYLNIACFVAYLLVLVYSARQLDFKWRFLIIFSIIFSPLLFQVNSTFTETQQGLFLTLSFLSLIKRRMISSSLFIFLSISTKETFILHWVIIVAFQVMQEMKNCLKMNLSRILICRFIGEPAYFFRSFFKNITKMSLANNQIRALIIGLLFGSIVDFGFNYLRYQQFKNTFYYSLNKHFSMNLNYTILNFIWSLISPNGGVIFAYGIFLSVVFLFLIGHQKLQLSAALNLKNHNVAATSGTSSDGVSNHLMELMMPIIVLMCGLSTTSLWWAAFGWDTWGNRLIIPYIMPLIMLTIMLIQEYDEYSGKSLSKSRKKYLDKNDNLFNRCPTLTKILVIISLMILFICGLIYNMVTIQAVYRKDIDVVRESLFSHPWCREMLSDSRGIIPYYWQCVHERFRYIPFLHHPPRILGREGKVLMSVAFISLFITLPFKRRWTHRNRNVDHQPRTDPG
jgi:hypothetical protein